mgnify:CR=1 FL=1
MHELRYLIRIPWLKSTTGAINQVMYTFFPGFSVFLFSIIGLGRNETVGGEQEKRWVNDENEKGRTRNVIETNIREKSC